MYAIIKRNQACILGLELFFEHLSLNTQKIIAFTNI